MYRKGRWTHTARVVNGRVNRFEEKMSAPSGRTKSSLFFRLVKLMVFLQFLEEKFSAPNKQFLNCGFLQEKENIASDDSNMDSDRPSSQ